MTRLIKVFWFVSLVVGLGVLLYVYAGLAEDVVYSIDQFGNPLSSIGREQFFYVALAILVIANFSLYTVSRSMRYKNSGTNIMLVNWQLSFAIVLNFFFIVSLAFLSVLNSNEHFNYDTIGYLVYVSLGLIFIWVIGLPALLIKNRISS